MNPKPIAIKAIQKYQIWIAYDDKTEGIVDLSHLANRGVFKEWEEKPDLFFKPYIDSQTNAIAWNETLELCPDSIYMKIVQQQNPIITYATN